MNNYENRERYQEDRPRGGHRNQRWESRPNQDRRFQGNWDSATSEERRYDLGHDSQIYRNDPFGYSRSGSTEQRYGTYGSEYDSEDDFRYERGREWNDNTMRGGYGGNFASRPRGRSEALPGLHGEGERHASDEDFLGYENTHYPTSSGYSPHVGVSSPYPRERGSRGGSQFAGSNFGTSDYMQNYQWEGERTSRTMGNAPQGRHYGRGPNGYKRSDEKLKEEISDQLMRHGDIDASDISIDVKQGVVTLRGTVESKALKRLVEDICDDVMGVTDVENQLRTAQSSRQSLNGGSKSQPQNKANSSAQQSEAK